MRQLHLIDISLTLSAPWLVHGNDPGRLGLDAVLMRDRLGRPLLPGTLLAGRISDAWTELRRDFGTGEQLPEPTQWFGSAANGFEPAHARLHVDDLVCETPPEQGASTANRIRIDADRQAVLPGMLMLAEQDHRPGQKVVFSGRWRAWLGDGEAASLRVALLAGLLWQDQLGAMATVGLGEVLGADVGIRGVDMPAPGAGREGHARRLRLIFDGPLCVGTRGNAGGNLFESADVIPGAALKAALADMWRRWRSHAGPVAAGGTALAQAFDALRIGHAFPAADPGRRPGIIPLSFVVTPGGALQDVCHCPDAELLDGAAPRFPIDWKGEDWGRASAIQGWGETARELRVRTAISPKSRTADAGKLFAYECVVAKGDTVWLADLTLPHSVLQPGAVWAELEQLLSVGVGPIGKTAAWGSAELLDAPGVSGDVWGSDSLDACPGTAVLQLLTPALLFAAPSVADKAMVDLHDLYQRSFDELSGGALHLRHFFASQTLSGGEYLMRRYVAPTAERMAPPAPCMPFVLTQPGSVFVLEPQRGREADALESLRRWRNGGLPLTSAVRAAHGIDWQANPFVPENGFGEVSVNAHHGLPVLQPATKEVA